MTVGVSDCCWPRGMSALFSRADFHEYLESYEAHPDALLCLRYIGDVGEMIVGDLNTESGEVKEGDAVRSFGSNDWLNSSDSQNGHEKN